jgi:hypothetical protein
VCKAHGAIWLLWIAAARVRVDGYIVQHGLAHVAGSKRSAQKIFLEI